MYIKVYIFDCYSEINLNMKTSILEGCLFILFVNNYMNHPKCVTIQTRSSSYPLFPEAISRKIPESSS